MAAAVGSLMMRITSSPAMNPASLVACRVQGLGFMRWITAPGGRRQRTLTRSHSQSTGSCFQLAARSLQSARRCCA